MKRANLEFLAIIQALFILIMQIRWVGESSTEIVDGEFVSDIIYYIFVLGNIEIELFFDRLVDLVDLLIVLHFLNAVL